MEHQYKLIVSSQFFYREFEIPADMEHVRLGTTSACEFRLDQDLFFEPIEVELEKKDGWNFLCGESLYINFGDVRKLYYLKAAHGDTFRIFYASSNEAAFEIRFLIDFEYSGTDYNMKLDLSQMPHPVIGDDPSASIRLRSGYCRNTAVSLHYTGKQVRIEEIHSMYGIYINGKRVYQNTVLSDYDFISIADFSAYYRNGFLYFGQKNVSLNGIPGAFTQESTDKNYPTFVRNTRLKSVVDDKKIKVLDPDAIPQKPDLNIVTSLVPSITMFALIIVLRGIMNTSGGTYVIFSICSMGIGVFTSVMNIVNNRKKYRERCEKRRDTYLDYVDRKSEEIRQARAEEVMVLRDLYYNTEEDIRNIESFSSRLFDRTPEDEDFLDVYLGTGRREAARKIEFKEQEKLDTGDDLTQIPSQMAESFKYIEDAPIVVPCRDANAVGIIGDKNSQYEFLKCMLVDIVSRQYFGDVNVYAFIDDDEQKYDWIRQLPHVQSNDTFRNIVCDNESKNVVFEYLYKELTYRSSRKDVEGYNVIVVLNEHGLKNHPISRFIEHAAELHTTFLFFETEQKYLPLHCSQIIQLEQPGTAQLYASSNKVEKTFFRYTSVSDAQMARISEMLAPIYCDEISLESSLRKNISLYELLGIYSAADLKLKERWEASRIYDSMEVPLGINVKNEKVSLNIHERFHGPHGLVAGTTGSGKSEILQSFILSAATYFHPYEIGFMIIDFKGGGMANQFRKLPHLLGTITNIDGAEVQRSLRSIRAELLKRQEYFAEAGVNHIDKYINLYKSGKVKEPLPHLVIIVDEFAELKAEQPDFMKELISTARIGRSLGVHLILATQKPSGVVDAQIWSNSNFKLCLKVQTKEDSNEVIKTPLASEIKEPGRAYLQVGNNEIFELFQSAFSGAPAAIDVSETDKAFSISEVGFTGNRKKIYVRKKTKKKSHSETQLEALVSYISQYCQKEKIEKLPDICMEPLSDCIPYQTVSYEKDSIRAAFGIFDDPDHQRQELYSLDLTMMNYMLIGSAQTGKTNFLQNVIRSVAENYTPEEVNIYIIDFSSMILKNFESLNHVGGVVLSYEDEKLKSLFRMLSLEITQRKAQMANAGVSSFSSYRESGYRDLPQILIVIDNLTALKELYLQDNDVLLPIMRDGNSVGISFVVSNAQTAGIGYRYLNNFEGRIALFCNESSEYGMLFESCRMRLPNKHGRALVQIEKEIYEAQMYLAFEGEKEFERVRNIRKFVDACNAQNAGSYAKHIPEIPQVLDPAYVDKNYRTNTGNRLMLGLDYESIDSVELDLTEQNMLVLSGRKNSGKQAFVTYLLELFLQKRFGKAEFYILDKMSGIWSDYELLPETAYYTTVADGSASILDEIEQICIDRYKRISERRISSLEQEPWIVLLIENNDAITDLSSDKNSVRIMRDLIDRYREMKVFVLFTDIANANIPFGAPEIMKMIKEQKKYLVFEDIGSVKMTDVPLSAARKFAKPIETGDAYLLTENAVRKLKTVSGS